MEELRARNITALPEAIAAPLESARFFDRLEDDKEQLWQQLIFDLKEAGSATNSQLIPLWVDETVPQVIRDRAMLVALGAWQPHYGTESKSWAWNGLGFSSPYYISRHEEVYPGFKVQQFADWLLQALAYQQKTGEALFDGAFFSGLSLYNLAINLYELDCYNDTQLESLIESVAPEDRLVGFASDDEYFEGRVDELQAGNQFPIIADGLSPVAQLASDSRFRQWCVRQLALWTEHRDGDRHELPEWMQAVDDSQERALYAQMVRDLTSRERSHQPQYTYLNWNLVRPGIERYGPELLFRSEQMGFEVAYYAQDAEISSAILEHILKQRAGKRAGADPPQPLSMQQVLQLDSWERHRKPAAGLIDLVKTEWDATEASEVDRKRRNQKIIAQLQREREQDPQHITRQEAKMRLGGVVDKLRSSAESTE